MKVPERKSACYMQYVLSDEGQPTPSLHKVMQYLNNMAN